MGQKKDMEQKITEENKSTKSKDAERNSKKASAKKKRDTQKDSGKFLKILICILGAAIVVVIVAICVIYYQFAYNAKKIAKETAKIYAFGDGDEMAEMIPPGYVESYEEDSQVLSISDLQDIYIGKFQTYVNDKVGNISDIECKITDIKALSNVADIRQDFEDNGVNGVSQYRSLEADWVVTGDEGAQCTIHIQEYVLKCDDGWYVDYVLFPDEVSETDLDSELEGDEDEDADTDADTDEDTDTDESTDEIADTE
jgi:cell division protein FtsL